MLLRLAIATTLLAATATLTAEPTSTEIAGRSRSVISQEYHEKEKRESEVDRPEDEDGLYPYRESTADELAAAVGRRDVVRQDTGNSVNEQPRRSIGDGWRDAVPGTPGTDYPNLDRIPSTSFTCGDKEPGGYYADVETGCQVFHVCNTGGVKSSFLCPPGSIFNQRYFVCDWWYGFDCDEAVELYHKRSDDSLESPSDEGLYEKSGNSPGLDENFEAREGLDSPPDEYRGDARIRNDDPTNDLSSAGSRRGTVDHPSRENNRMDQPTRNSEPNGDNVVFTDSRNPTKDENGSRNENSPRGFSRNESESLKRRKFDRTSNSHDLTNDLASYVNYAYFEAGLDNDRKNDNNNDDTNSRNYSSDGTGSKVSPENDARSGDKYVYGERTRLGYYSSDDP